MEDKELAKQAISFLESLDNENYSGSLSYLSGRSFTDAIRYLTYLIPITRKIGKYYVMDWVCTSEEDEAIASAFKMAEESGNLEELQKNYCFVEPEIQLYGVEKSASFDYQAAQRMLLLLIKCHWENYFLRFSNGERFVVTIDQEAGRVEFYQDFD